MSAATDAAIDEDPGDSSRRPQIIGALLTPVFLVGLFWLAGGVGWIHGWLWLGVLVVGQTASTVLVRRKDPEVIRRRGEYGVGTKSWDRIILPAFAATYVALVLLAALDARTSWSPPMAWWWPAIGLGVYAVGTWLLTWSMQVNTHFEKTVRIQHDRDHRVIDTGPYRYVRHPGYVATVLAFAVAPPLLLGSWLAFAAGAAIVAIFILRTALEDRTLHAELDGYPEYAARTRARLVPGIW